MPAAKPQPEIDIPTPTIEPGATSFDWTLGGEPVTITKLKFKPSLQVAKKLLGYLDKIISVTSSVRPAIADAQANGVSPASVVLTDSGVDAIKALNEVLDPDDLVAVAAALLGISQEQAANADLEELLTACIGAVELNSVPRLLQTVRVLSQKLGLGGG